MSRETVRAYGFDEQPVFLPGEPSDLGAPPAAIDGTLGASLSDFQAWIDSGDQHFASAWAQIEAQLKAEGASDSDLNTAKISLVNSLDGLASTVGLSGADAIDKAKDFVLVGKTALGAAQMVDALVSAVQTEPPAQLVETFTGAMIGIGVALGAFSVGIGTAIMAGVGAVLSALEQAGAFVSQPPDVHVPNCGDFPTKPQFLVGCLGVYSNVWDLNNYNANQSPIAPGLLQIAPGSPRWRNFPEVPDRNWTATYPGSGDFNSATTTTGGIVWFLDINRSVGITDPQGVLFAYPKGATGRPIDLAFPRYDSIATAASSAPKDWRGDFVGALFSAWKANAAYALNGITPRPDAYVLAQTLRFWNASHAGPGVPLSTLGVAYLDDLAQETLGIATSDDTFVQGSDLIVNPNPKSIPTAPRVVHLAIHAPAAPVGARGPGSSSSGATAPPAAAGAPLLAAAAAGGLGYAAWRYLGRPMTWAALKGAVRRIVG